MKSILPVLFMLLLLYGCSQETPEDRPLDQLARMIEEKAPYYWEANGFHWEYLVKEGTGKVVVDVNRVEVSEGEVPDEYHVMLRNSVRAEIYNGEDQWLLTVAANEGLLIPGPSIRFRKGVLVDLGDGFQLEADSLEINRAAKRFTSGPGFRLFTEVRLSEEDSTQFAVLEGDSISVSYAFDEWEIEAAKVSISETDTTIAN